MLSCGFMPTRAHDYFLADDLSGALDAAAAFQHAGRRVRIVLRPERWVASGGDEVIGITTETRNVAPEAAATTVRTVIGTARARGGRLVYKKIDSTLRGPVRAELEALLAELPDCRVLFAPANPKVGRTVVNGQLLVHGVPVHQTEFGRDPAAPIASSDIATLLGELAPERVTIPDTANERDLERSVAEMDRDGAAWVGVGSGALAKPLAARSAAANPSLTTTPVAVGPSPLLMLGGSAHPANRGQAAALSRVHGVIAHELSLGRPEVAAQAAASALGHAGSAALLAPAARSTAAEILRVTVRAGEHLVESAGVRRCFVTGGETAYALCAALEIESLEYLDEIEPGLSLSLGVGRAGALLLAVKPGGFGDENTWIRAWERLRAAP